MKTRAPTGLEMEAPCSTTGAKCSGSVLPHFSHLRFIMTTPDDLAIFRRMLDPDNWPVDPDDVLICEGEVWAFVSDDPNEECIYRPLFRKFQ